MSEHRPALVELRVLEGANLYFPRPAVKLTLDVSSLLDLDDDAARAVARALGMAVSRPGARGTGLRQRFAEPHRRDPVAAGGQGSRSDPAGGPGPATARPAPARGGLPVAAPGPRARRWPTRWPACSTGCPTSTAGSRRRRRSCAAPTRVSRPPCAGRTCRSSRSPAPTARPRPRAWWRGWGGARGWWSAGRRPTACSSTAGWSRPATTPARAVPVRCSTTRPSSSRSPRRLAAASCSRASASRTTTSRSSPTCRPTTSACTAWTPSTSSRRSRRSSPGSPARTAGWCSTATTPARSLCAGASTRTSACSRATPTRRRCGPPSTRVVARSPSSTGRSPCSTPAATPTS